MKKNFIISILLSFIYILTACASTSDAPPPTIEPAPAVTSEPTKPPISDLQIDNGGNISPSTQTPETQFYIGNKNSKKFHRPDCWTFPAEKKQVKFTNRTDAVNAGYSPCGNCLP